MEINLYPIAQNAVSLLETLVFNFSVVRNWKKMKVFLQRPIVILVYKFFLVLLSLTENEERKELLYEFSNDF